MSARVNSDSAKCVVIFWCLLAFIASGFEHSVANMTLLGIALAGNHPESVSLAGFAWNLGWVTLGNAIGGAIFVGGAYHVASYGFPGMGVRSEPVAQVGDDCSKSRSRLSCRRGAGRSGAADAQGRALYRRGGCAPCRRARRSPRGGAAQAVRPRDRGRQ